MYAFKNAYKYACIHIHLFICIHFFKTFLKLCRINGVRRIIVLVAATYYTLIFMLFMSNLVHFLPSKLMSHHRSYLFCI